jgi:hypothetical protein
VVTSIPFVNRTRATFLKAEFGFLGVDVYTRVHTPRFCGHSCNAGLLVLYFGLLLPCRTNWLNVGTNLYSSRVLQPPNTKPDGRENPTILLKTKLILQHSFAFRGIRTGSGFQSTSFRMFGHSSSNMIGSVKFCSYEGEPVSLMPLKIPQWSV